jgi:hypothetical protein
MVKPDAPLGTSPLNLTVENVHGSCYVAYSHNQLRLINSSITLTASVSDVIEWLDELLDGLDAENPDAVNDAVSDIRNFDTFSLAEAMQASDEVLESIAALEQAHNDINGIDIIYDSVIDGVEITGAGLNADGGEVTLSITPSDADVEFDEGKYLNGIQHNITLEGEGVTPEQLAVPVMITVPIPAGFDPDRFRILHFFADGSYTLIVPQISEDRTTASFVLTRFSVFVFVEVRPNYGDIDNDGVIDSADVTLLRRFIAQNFANDAVRDVWIAANGFNLTNAHVRGESYISPADVTLLRRYIAAYNKSTVPLGPQP